MTKFVRRPDFLNQKGFIGDPVENGPAQCENVNECSLQKQGVCNGGESEQICIDQPGGFTCTCGAGYSGEPSLNEAADCTDIDECDTGIEP